MESQAEQNYIDLFVKNCRELKLSVTPQRLAIYKALLKHDNHPGPEIIYRSVHPENPTISKATVYKTLETFEKYGIISRVTSLHNTVRYDPLTIRHHHIVCVKCKKVVDLDDRSLDEIKIPSHVLDNNCFIDFSVHFKVICADCQKN